MEVFNGTNWKLHDAKSSPAQAGFEEALHILPYKRVNTCEVFGALSCHSEVILRAHVEEYRMATSLRLELF